MDFASFLPIILLFILFFLKVPVAYSLLISSAIYFLFINNDLPVQFIVQGIFSTTESFTMLAIPFFVCAGVVFNYAGITERLMKLAEYIIGHLQGGMGHVNVLLSLFMGGLSGSSNADAAMQTKIVVPQMTKLGYDKGFSVAITAASSTITPIIPPGILLILYGVVANVSITQLFFAGYLPGIVMAIALMIAVHFISKKRNFQPSREKIASFKQISLQFIDSIWALLLPLGIIMGLRFGLFTPTEAGAMCILYAVLVGMFIYKELKFRDFGPILKESALATAEVMILIGSAMAFGSYLTFERIPHHLTEFLFSNVDSQFTLLLMIVIFLIIIGLFLDGTAAVILLTPLFVPIVAAMGIDPVYFGIIMCVTLVIGGITPPFGTMMFITMSISGISTGEYMRNIIPFFLVLLAVILLFLLFPQIITIVPDLLL
ncbi:TRAP transporter large permease [Salinicoccus sp. Marseille-QA3877]